MEGLHVLQLLQLVDGGLQQIMMKRWTILQERIAKIVEVERSATKDVPLSQCLEGWACDTENREAIINLMQYTFIINIFFSIIMTLKF